MQRYILGGVGVALMCGTSLVQAQDLSQSLLPPNLVNGFRHGTTLAVEGNTLVVGDMGFKADAPAPLCGGIDDGAVHIYTRTEPSMPWPDEPNQTFYATGRENHFGSQVILTGDTLIIGEERGEDNSTSASFDGAFHYYRRANANSPFTLVDTEFRPSDAEGNLFTEAGLASNGTYAVAVGYGDEPNVYVYSLTSTGTNLLYSFTASSPLNFSKVVLTSNNMLVAVRRNDPQVQVYQIGPSSASAVDASQLTLSNGLNEVDNQHLDNLSVEGTRVVIGAQRKSTALASNGVISYYLKTFELGTGVVANVERIDLPLTYTSATGYELPPNALDVAPGPYVFVNVVGSQSTNGNTLVALGYGRAQNGGFEKVVEIDAGDFSPNAGLGVHQNYGRPVVFDGKLLYVGDSEDTTAEELSGLQCNTRPRGMVQVFDNVVPTNPSTVCAGAQDVVFTLDPVPGAESYSWWSSGATQVVSNGNSAVVDFGGWFTDTTVNMDVNLNQPPYFIRHTLNVTAKNCASAPPPLQGPTTACLGQGGVVYGISPIANATFYNWWSPGATNVFSYGSGAVVNFGTWSPNTTVNVHVGLSVPPYSQTYSVNVALSGCN